MKGKQLAMIFKKDLKENSEHLVKEEQLTENELKKRARYHAKRQKGLSPFCSLSESKLGMLQSALINLIEFLQMFEDIDAYKFPDGKLISNSWKDLLDGVTHGTDSEFEVAEILLQYFKAEYNNIKGNSSIMEDSLMDKQFVELYDKLAYAFDTESANYIEECVSESQTLEEDFNTTKQIRNELEEYLHSRDDMKYVYDDMWIEDDRIIISVHMGDWKHEHRFLEVVVTEWFNSKGIEVEVSSETTESDGSDCYSANHTFRITGTINPVILDTNHNEVDEAEAQKIANMMHLPVLNKGTGITYYPNLELHESKKKKKPYDSINLDAGNVEYNVAMFNQMNGTSESPSISPINGTVESLQNSDSLNESDDWKEKKAKTDVKRLNDDIQKLLDSLDLHLIDEPQIAKRHYKPNFIRVDILLAITSSTPSQRHYVENLEEFEDKYMKPAFNKIDSFAKERGWKAFYAPYEWIRFPFEFCDFYVQLRIPYEDYMIESEK